MRTSLLAAIERNLVETRLAVGRITAQRRDIDALVRHSREMVRASRAAMQEADWAVADYDGVSGARRAPPS